MVTENIPLKFSMDLLEKFKTAPLTAPSTGGLSFLRKLAKQAKAEDEKAAKRKAQEAHATVKKLVKLAKANGLSVSGFSIGAHGVTVNTAEASSAKTVNASANPWDAELS